MVDASLTASITSSLFQMVTGFTPPDFTDTTERSGQTRMADDDRRLEKNNEVGRNTDVEDGIKKNQACKVAQEATAEAQEDTGVAREGEDTPDLDLGDQGDSEVTREGEDTPELGLGDRGNTKATRAGRGRRKPSWTWRTGGT